MFTYGNQHILSFSFQQIVALVFLCLDQWYRGRTLQTLLLKRQSCEIAQTLSSVGTLTLTHHGSLWQAFHDEF